MVKKFQSIFRNRIAWKSLLKAASLTLALFGVAYFEFSFWAVLVFFSLSLAIYFSLPKDRSHIKFSFWLLQIFGFLGSVLPAVENFFGIFIFISFGILALTLFLIVHFVFKDRFLIYGVWNVLFLFLVFSEFFYFDFPQFLEIVLLFLVLVLIFEEVFRFFGIIWRERILLASLVLSLLGIELFWLVSLLPLGFVNAAVFLALSLLLLRDAVLFHLQGVLTRVFIFKELTFFVTISILIFAASKWAI